MILQVPLDSHEQKICFWIPGKLRKDDYYRHDEYLLDGVEVLPTTHWTIYKEVKKWSFGFRWCSFLNWKILDSQPLIFRGECIGWEKVDLLPQVIFPELQKRWPIFGVQRNSGKRKNCLFITGNKKLTFKKQIGEIRWNLTISRLWNNLNHTDVWLVDVFTYFVLYLDKTGEF